MHQGVQGDPSFLCAGAAILNFLLVGASQDVPKHPWCLLILVRTRADIEFLLQGAAEGAKTPKMPTHSCAHRCTQRVPRRPSRPLA